MTTRSEFEELLSRPESSSLDWKREFPAGLVSVADRAAREKARGTVLKDLSALANTAGDHDRFLIYGVADVGGRRDVRGITGQLDDADLQQWARPVFDPPIDFSYAEIALEDGIRVGVLRIPRPTQCPHVAIRTVGDLHEGQTWLRRGTKNEIALRADLERMFTSNDYSAVARLFKPVDLELEGRVRHFSWYSRDESLHVLPEEAPRQLLSLARPLCNLLTAQDGLRPEFNSEGRLEGEPVFEVSADFKSKWRLLGGEQQDGGVGPQVLVVRRSA